MLTELKDFTSDTFFLFFKSIFNAGFPILSIYSSGKALISELNWFGWIGRLFYGI
jgi:hypothetical protein